MDVFVKRIKLDRRRGAIETSAPSISTPCDASPIPRRQRRRLLAETPPSSASNFPSQASSSVVETDILGRDDGFIPASASYIRKLTMTSSSPSSSSAFPDVNDRLVRRLPSRHRRHDPPRQHQRHKGAILSFLSPVALVLSAVAMLAPTTTALPPLPVAIAPEGQCRVSLGMQSGNIPDDAIAASSSYDSASVGPHNARIRTEKNGGAWCPRHQITKTTYEWLEVDLEKLTVITLVETQGRFGNGQGQEFAEQYRLEYQRVQNGTWVKFTNRRGHEIFQGNTNTYIAELREVDPPIIARKVRFVPYSSHPRTVCMRVEMYGCPWKDGLVSYNMRQGDRRGSEVDLYDFTYDGDQDNGFLSGGLGQLTDGEYGQDNFRLDPRGRGMKGYEWVGWKNDTTKGTTGPVEIVFKFEQVRNFTHMVLHCNNLFSKDVQVFAVATIWFSVGGTYYQDPPIIFRYMPDIVMELARPIYIRLNSRVAKYIKVQLTFAARWLMISEVTFESVPVIPEPPPEQPPPDKESEVAKPPAGGTKEEYNDVNKKNPGGGVGGGVDSGSLGGEQIVKKGKASDRSESQVNQYVGLIIGVLAATFILMIVIIILIVIRLRRLKGSPWRDGSQVEGDKNAKIDLAELSALNSRNSYPNLYGNLVTGTDDACSNASHCDANPYKDPSVVTHSSGVNGYNGIYCEPWDTASRRKLPEVPLPHELIVAPDGTLRGTLHANPFNLLPEQCANRDYAVPDVAKPSYYRQHVYGPNPTGTMVTPPMVPMPMPGHASLPHGAYPLPGMTPPPHQPVMEPAYNVTEIVKPCNLQGVSGNTVYAVPPSIDLLKMESEEPKLPEVPRERLKFQEKLGEGQFGEVHLCEVSKLEDIIGEDNFTLGRTLGKPMLVAVKTLREAAGEQAKSDFFKEMKILARLKDANIIRVLGVCTEREPLFMIVEYMKYGDLNQFLQRHVPESNIAKMTNADCLGYGALVYMATQIASGMKYLESLNLVHRDLATRNCLVGAGFTIKVSDFGMSRSLYSSDYYRLEGSAVLPIRWMAWESVLMGKFTCKTDVWAFGVALWEILTLAKEQPFASVTDEGIVENLRQAYAGSGLQIFLPQPLNCPREVYDLMLQCWARDDLQRPAFKEIHLFLTMKNKGYIPPTE